MAKVSEKAVDFAYSVLAESEVELQNRLKKWAKLAKRADVLDVLDKVYPSAWEYADALDSLSHPPRGVERLARIVRAGAGLLG